MTDDVIPLTDTGADAAARLCNFITARHDLLSTHRRWLNLTAAPIIRSAAEPFVDIVGYASRVGAADYNQKLSRRRCDSVKEVARRYNARVTFPLDVAKGESVSTGPERDNSGYWRAVDVFVYWARPAPPIPTPTPVPVPTGSTQFRVRVFRASGASILIVAGDAIVFQIVDDTIGACGVYYYVGGGLALSIKGITTPPGSIGGAGSFSLFTTIRPVTLDDFEGEASYFQDPSVTVGSHSLGGNVHLGFSSTRLRQFPGLRATVVRPSVVTLGTGSGFGAGLGSVTTGRLSAPVKFAVGECCRAPGGVCSRFV